MAKSTDRLMPILKTVEQMSRISGIGENRLRELIAKGEIEYVQKWQPLFTYRSSNFKLV